MLLGEDDCNASPQSADTCQQDPLQRNFFTLFFAVTIWTLIEQEQDDHEKDEAEQLEKSDGLMPEDQADNDWDNSLEAVNYIC